MLLELTIRDFAIIDDLTLEMGPGLIVFTGETGAGKSISVDAVEIVLGGRAESVLVRSGSERAMIEATFRIPPSVSDEIREIIDREELGDEPDYVILGREIRREGRNLCRVNGRVAPMAILRELGELLVDVHGQSEHLSLLRVPEHLNLLDRYARVDGFIGDYAEVYKKLEEIRGELRNLREKERESAQRADLLAYQIEEIKASALEPGEDQHMGEERTRLANAEQIAGIIQKTLSILDDEGGERPSVADLLGEVSHTLAGLIKVDPSTAPQIQQADDLTESMMELVNRLRRYQEQIAHDPDRLNEVEERLNLIQNLKRKYAEDIPAILTYMNNAEKELETITHAEERIEELLTFEDRYLKEIVSLGVELSKLRSKAASLLSGQIESELDDLRMAGAKFSVQQEWQDDETGVQVDDRRVALHSNGLDRVEFLVAPNPGEGLKPLTKIASGGETTRLMLGLKGVLAQADRTPTLIFDEIDQGIGGRVGSIVGQKLWNLSREHQVLCITHLPQLAAYGDAHFNVEKEIQAGRTHTVTHRLEGEDRVTELALMLGGETEPNLKSAAELLTHASKAD
jgi:DNA repair protein RecN (Recombination protein N)